MSLFHPNYLDNDGDSLRLASKIAMARPLGHLDDSADPEFQMVASLKNQKIANDDLAKVFELADEYHLLSMRLSKGVNNKLQEIDKQDFPSSQKGTAMKSATDSAFSIVQQEPKKKTPKKSAESEYEDEYIPMKTPFNSPEGQVQKLTQRQMDMMNKEKWKEYDAQSKREQKQLLRAQLAEEKAQNARAKKARIAEEKARQAEEKARQAEEKRQSNPRRPDRRKNRFITLDEDNDVGDISEDNVPYYSIPTSNAPTESSASANVEGSGRRMVGGANADDVYDNLFYRLIDVTRKMNYILTTKVKPKIQYLTASEVQRLTDIFNMVASSHDRIFRPVQNTTDPYSKINISGKDLGPYSYHNVKSLFDSNNDEITLWNTERNTLMLTLTAIINAWRTNSGDNGVAFSKQTQEVFEDVARFAGGSRKPTHYRMGEVSQFDRILDGMNPYPRWVRECPRKYLL